MASQIVGLLGLKRSGKDTFAARLVDAHGFTRIAFADPLKEAALALDPIIREEVRFNGDSSGFTQYPWQVRISEVVAEEGWEAAKERTEVRRTLQNLGVAIRAIDEDFWLNAAIRRAESVDGPVVITDVRFPNEVGYIARHGVTVRIVRPGQINADPHVSETALAETPTAFTVLNDADVASLHKFADDLVQRLP